MSGGRTDGLRVRGAGPRVGRRPPVDPVVSVSLVTGLDGERYWRAGPCPFCGRSHDYPAGDGGRDDPRGYLGMRLSLCGGRGRADWLALEEAR